jgi:hypothetical protein
MSESVYGAVPIATPDTAAVHAQSHEAHRIAQVAATCIHRTVPSVFVLPAPERRGMASAIATASSPAEAQVALAAYGRAVEAGLRRLAASDLPLSKSQIAPLAAYLLQHASTPSVSAYSAAMRSHACD